MGVDVRVRASCRSRSRSSCRASARNADAEPDGRPAAQRRCGSLSAIFGVGILAGAIALFVAPVDLGKHWLWPLTPLLARAVAAWYALFGTMLISCAIGMRRPADAIIPYATLGCWSVLLLLAAACCTTTTSAAAASGTR